MNRIFTRVILMKRLLSRRVVSGDESPYVSVLRLGHRRDRDKRITSHLGLTARAFGANEILLSGDDDQSALETWRNVTKRFGGNFKCSYEKKPLSLLRNFSKKSGSGQYLRRISAHFAGSHPLRGPCGTFANRSCCKHN